MRLKTVTLLATMSYLICPFGAWAYQDAATAAADEKAVSQATLKLAQSVYKEIYRLPQYAVFDNLHFAIKGNDTVILRGEASRPILKSSAENVVKRLEGVNTVQNEIEVLPLSPNDDRIRALTYARIYGDTFLRRYTSNRGPQFLSLTRVTMGITQDPPIGWHAIHIIVKNGNIRLVGVVDNSTDSIRAGMLANQVPGSFAVDNDLSVAAKEIQAADKKKK